MLILQFRRIRIHFMTAITAYRECSWMVWSVFTSGNQKITKEKMDQIGGAITRFYESYPDSVALDLAYCIKEGISFENEDDLPSECQERFFRF